MAMTTRILSGVIAALLALCGWLYLDMRGEQSRADNAELDQRRIYADMAGLNATFAAQEQRLAQARQDQALAETAVLEHQRTMTAILREAEAREAAMETARSNDDDCKTWMDSPLPACAFPGRGLLD
jgi:hypothetical protein